MHILWRKSLFNYLLWPFSLIYRASVFLRRKLYQWHFLPVNYFPIPIVVVGNITVGGTGKTPLVIALVEYLKQTGWRPGIISRGYGGKAPVYPYRVHEKSNPREAGDEPVLMSQYTHCPVVVDPKRSRAVKYLIGKTHANIIVSDDGLQHLSLARDIEIAVLDGQRRLGNGFCLPAGPLRESAARLKQVDFIVTKGKAHENEFEMLLLPEYFYQLINPTNKKSLDFFQGKKIYAVAGIGNPNQFFRSLSNLGLNFTKHPFPDHYRFKPSDFTKFGKDAVIVMTEKDAVKCIGFVDARLWSLKTQAKLDESFFNAFSKKLSQLNKNPKSSLGMS